MQDFCLRKKKGPSQAIVTRLRPACLPLVSDNGSEFTPSRSYKKLALSKVEGNDQAHVEQKNCSVPRRLVGYARMEPRYTNSMILLREPTKGCCPAECLMNTSAKD